ncbi:hypothetical protein PTTG_12503, partial [Puccinia triticina 1-1 BBBD Race 1]
MLLTWLIASCWLFLTVLTCFKARRKTCLLRSSHKYTFFRFGLGWMHVETEALNDLPTGFLNIFGVLHYPTNSRPFRDPKTFDDPWSDAEPSRARSLRKPSGWAKIKRLTPIAFYDIGAVLSVMGVLVALATVLHLSFCLISQMCNLFYSSTQPQESWPTRVFDTPSHPVFTATHQLVKRAKLPAHESFSLGTTSYPHPTGMRAVSSSRPKQNKNAMLLQLAIPGLTIPLGTLPKFLIALILSQIIHESGHALAAALNSVLLESVGFYIFFPLIPVCYVKTLGPNDVQNTRGHDKITHAQSLRIATAGVWHNLVLAFICWLAWHGGPNLFDSTVGQVFWKDIDSHGVMVAHVSQESTLRPLLRARDIVTQIDDISLQGNDFISSPRGNGFISIRRWDNYLSDANHSFQASPKDMKGWCFPQAKFETFSSDCCQVVNLDITWTTPSSVCFRTRESKHEPVTARCLEHETIAHLESRVRCTTDVDCPEKNTCVEPTPGQNLVRIESLVFTTGTSRTILYRGSKESLRREVSVTSLMPRVSFISANLILIIHEMFSLLMSLSLGLAFVNLLPIKNFDGLAICQAVALFISSPPLNDDLEDMYLGLDVYLLGHGRPPTAADQAHQPRKMASVETQQSILFKFLNFLTCLLKKNPTLVDNRTVNNSFEIP